MSWTTKRDLACWHYGVGRREDIAALVDVEPFLDETWRACLALLGDFGSVREDVAERGTRTAAIDLSCLDADGTPFVVERGADLRLHAWLRDDTAPGNGTTLELRRVHPIELILALHVDLAAPLPDRLELAHRNAPRLGALLLRIEQLPAELFGIEAPGYEKMAGSGGFHEPDKIGRAC